MRALEDEITELWGHISAATYRFLELIADFDDSGRWGGAGCASCAHWLNLTCGISTGAAREKLRVARALRELPKVSEAFRQGRISYSKARAITRIGTFENEQTLLDIALYGTASHVERTVRAYRRVERIEAAALAAKAEQERYVHIREDEDGSIVIQARLPGEVGALVRKALEVAMAEAETTEEEAAHREPVDGSTAVAAHAENTVSDVPAETPPAAEPSEPLDPFDYVPAEPEDRWPEGARRADALGILAAHFLASADRASGASSDRYQVVVHIDHDLLRASAGTSSREHGLGPRQAGIEDGPAIAPETARRLGCDGALIALIEGKEGEPLSFGRKTRAIPQALRRALKARDGGCRFPGCDRTRYCEGHHLEHWADGGENKLSNLILLCLFHHHLVHEGGYGVRRTALGCFEFTCPNGEILLAGPPAHRRFRGDLLPKLNEAWEVSVDPKTIVTRWQGERMDYGIAIDNLLRAREHRHENLVARARAFVRRQSEAAGSGRASSRKQAGASPPVS